MSTTRYEERLSPPPAVWLTPSAIAIMAALTFLPYGPWFGMGAAVVGGGLAAWGLHAMSKQVRVTDTTLIAGGASIPLSHIDDVVCLIGDAARHARGPGADVRAFLCIQGWVDDAVKVTINDPEDPTPYWLISTRHPQDLAAALGHSQARVETTKPHSANPSDR